MRSTSLLLSVLVAACSSSSSRPPIDLVPDTPDRVESLACQSTLSEACGSCNPTLDAALEDPRLCEFGLPGAVEACGDLVVVHRAELDTQTLYYYRDGQLAAAVSAGIGGSLDVLHCFAGPQSFDAPHCNGEHAVALPACSSTH